MHNCCKWRQKAGHISSFGTDLRLADNIPVAAVAAGTAAADTVTMAPVLAEAVQAGKAHSANKTAAGRSSAMSMSVTRVDGHNSAKTLCKMAL